MPKLSLVRLNTFITGLTFRVLDDDFLINVSLEKQDGKLSGFVRLRSKTKVNLTCSPVLMQFL